MAALREKFVVDKRGRKTGVVMSLRRYRRLIEDLHDLSAIAERGAERPVGFRALKRRFRRDGLI